MVAILLFEFELTIIKDMKKEKDFVYLKEYTRITTIFVFPRVSIR